MRAERLQREHEIAPDGGRRRQDDLRDMSRRLSAICQAAQNTIAVRIGRAMALTGSVEYFIARASGRGEACRLRPLGRAIALAAPAISISPRRCPQISMNSVVSLISTLARPREGDRHVLDDASPGAAS